MTYDSVSDQELAWPEPKQEQVLDLFKESCRTVVCPQKKGAGRPAKVCWSHLCLALLVCFLRGWNAQLEVWRLIGSETVGLFAPVTVSDQAVYNRIEQAPQHMRQVFESVSAWLRDRLAGREERDLAPWASEVYATDASTLDRMARVLPWLRQLAPTDYARLGGQINALFDVRRQQWVRVDFWREAKANCKQHFFSLIEAVQAGALLLMDRGYFSFALFDELTRQGIWWISRYANRATYQISFTCYQADGVLDAIIYLGTGADQAQYPVRLIQFWRGKRHYQYLTNVLDPHQLSLANVVALYARRWDIELAFRLLKEHLNLNHLWSAKWPVIQVQLWCGLILAQVYHALQVEIAAQAEVEVFDVSIEVLVRLTPGWLSRGLRPIEQAVRFGRIIGLIRPSTRHLIEVPWIDPIWVSDPPEEAIQPRVRARKGSHGKASSKTAASGPKKAG